MNIYLGRSPQNFLTWLTGCQDSYLTLENTDHMNLRLISAIDLQNFILCFWDLTNEESEIECVNRKLIIPNVTEALRELPAERGGGSFWSETVSPGVLTVFNLAGEGWVGQFFPKNS